MLKKIIKVERFGLATPLALNERSAQRLRLAGPEKASGAFLDEAVQSRQQLGSFACQ